MSSTRSHPEWQISQMFPKDGFMDHSEGVGLQPCRGQIGWISTLAYGWSFVACISVLDGSLLVMRELDDALGLSDLASVALCDEHRGKNIGYRLARLFRWSVYGWATRMSTMLIGWPSIPSTPGRGWPGC
jgi:hypothetical protein